MRQAGWTLSGLQKTTSHEFEGRWAGESTRSAYLFFHPAGDEPVSIDVLLDETGRGLGGNLALVADLRPLADHGDTEALLGRLADLAVAVLPVGLHRPVTLRARLDDAAERPGSASVEVRFKVRIPRAVIARGHDAVRTLSAGAVAAFAELLASPDLAGLLVED